MTAYTADSVKNRVIRCTVCNHRYETKNGHICPECGYPMLTLCGSSRENGKEIFAYREKKGIRTSGMYVGQKYRMGNYRGTEITWQVLSVENDEALLISERGIDAVPYHTCRADNMTWADSSIRKWLNTSFLKAAFGPVDQERINESQVTADKNPYHAAAAGKTAEDKIFLLSIEEAERYFRNDRERTAEPTGYAQEHGAFIAKSNACSWWWLRTAGGNRYGAAAVGNSGHIHAEGRDMTSENICVRPCLRVDVPVSDDPSEPIRAGRKTEFGVYAGEPISWKVLAADGEKALLLSEKGLAPMAWHRKFEDSTWDGCTLRKWLNTEFLKKAFGPLDQSRILTETVPAEKNQYSDTDPGIEIKDRVFLLNVQEVEKYLKKRKDRLAYPTEHAEKEGAYVDSSTGCCWWWLRCPGQSGNTVMFVDDDGFIYYNGNYVSDENVCIRPAMWIKLP